MDYFSLIDASSFNYSWMVLFGFCCKEIKIDKSNTLFLFCSPLWLLKQEVPKIVKSINRQLCEKSVKTKVGAWEKV